MKRPDPNPVTPQPGKAGNWKYQNRKFKSKIKEIVQCDDISKKPAGFPFYFFIFHFDI
jgi:hypothetical protein